MLVQINIFYLMFVSISTLLFYIMDIYKYKSSLKIMVSSAKFLKLFEKYF